MHSQIPCGTDYMLRGYCLRMFAVFVAQSPSNPEKSIHAATATNSYTDRALCTQRFNGAGHSPVHTRQKRVAVMDVADCIIP